MTDATDLFKAEEVFYKRDFTTAERRKLAKEGKALPDGSYPIETAADLHPAAVLARSGHGDAEAGETLIARRAKEMKAPNPLDDDAPQETKKSELAFTVGLVKGEIEGKFYAPLVVPGIPDAHGDIFSKEEIERTAHAYMRELPFGSTEPNIEHGERAAGAHLVETWLIKSDTTIGGERLPEGTWVIGLQVTDPLTKQEIEDRTLDCLSFEGFGIRTPVAA